MAERTLDINSLQPIEAVIDLTGTENVLFTGCPPAVGPYLNGDIPAAARALERDGQVQTSHLLLAGFYRDRDQHDSAARHYEQAGRPLEAAELREHLSQFAESAPLYEQAGETARAADMYRSAGECNPALVRTASCR